MFMSHLDSHCKISQGFTILIGKLLKTSLYGGLNFRAVFFGY